MSVPTKNATWTIRAYHPGDEHGIVALFERSFSRPISEEHWRWKFKQLPAPVENVWLAVAGDRPIFQYAGIPMRYQIAGQEVAAIMVVDTMTDPDFRRRGLLMEVGTFCADFWRRAGVPFITGLPNQQWGSRIPGLGWQPLFPLRWLIRPLRPEALLARRVGLPALARFAWAGTLWNALWDRGAADAGLQIRQVEQAGAEFDQLWQRCRGDMPASVVRDSAWVNWRYLAAPSFDYRVLLAERSGQPAGYIAYRLEQTVGNTWGFITDLLTPRADAAPCRALIKRAVDDMRAVGAAAVTAPASPRTWLFQTLRRAGFVLGRKGSFTFHLIPLAADVPLELLRDPTNWHIAGGDFDII